MATKKPSPAMEFVVAALKKDPALDYGTVRTAATKKGLVLFPIMYGRAKALLGLVPVAPRGSKKKAAKKAPPVLPRGKVARRNHDRGGSVGPLDSLQGLIADMQGVASDRDRYRQALEQIAKIIETTL